VGILCGQLSLGTEALKRPTLPDKGSRQAVPVFANGPLWMLDVRALGYEAYPAARELRGGPPSAGPICFPTERQVVVTFVTQQAPGPLPRRGQPDDSLPFRLHALFINAKTGHVDATREWPTASNLARVVPALGGRFVVITPDRLMLYSPDLELLKGLDLPISREASRDAWEFLSSQGGRYLLLQFEPRTLEKEEADSSLRGVQLELVDVENLEVIQKWRPKRWDFLTSLSDDRLALKMGGKIGRPEGPFHWLCSPAEPYCRGGRFLDDHTIFSDFLEYATISEKRMYFVSISGELLFSERCPKGDLFREAFSADGRRLALQVFKAKGGISALDIAPHYALMRVMVYDIPSRRWVYTLDAKKQRIKMDPDRFSRELALSPDGSLLGLITQDGMLELYPLPETSPPSSPTQ